MLSSDVDEDEETGNMPTTTTSTTTDPNLVQPSIPAQYSKNDIDKMSDEQVISLGLGIDKEAVDKASENSKNPNNKTNIQSQFAKDAQTEVSNRIGEIAKNKMGTSMYESIIDDILRDL